MGGVFPLSRLFCPQHSPEVFKVTMTFNRFSILTLFELSFLLEAPSPVWLPGFSAPVPQADSRGASGVAQVLFPVLSLWVAASTSQTPRCVSPAQLPFLDPHPPLSLLGHLPGLHTTQPEGPQLFPRSTFSGGGGLVTQSCLTLSTPWTVACQGPLSMGFSKQEHWSGLPFPSPGDLPDPGIEPRSPIFQADSLPTEL